MSLGLHTGAEANSSQQPLHPPSFFPPVPTQGGLYTTYTITCADQPSLLSPNTNVFSPTDRPSPTISHSGSSAENSSHYTDDEDVDFLAPQPHYTHELTSEPASLESCSFVDTTPIYASERTIGYGLSRILFIEKLIWDCVDKVYAIYGEPASQVGLATSVPLEQLVYDGLIHGLCNEIVILPVVAALHHHQKQQLSPNEAAVASRPQAELIPFPLFMAEMLRRMKSSYFLLLTTMRYIVDIESAIRASRERAQCGWCRSGAYGCAHSAFVDPAASSRFSRGRVSNSKRIRGEDSMKPPQQQQQQQQQQLLSNGNMNGMVIPLSRFSKPDPLSPLADPRKVFLGALLLANKFHRDRSIGNKSWATLIGLPLEEVHSAERAVGQALGWTLSRPWMQETQQGAGEDARMPGSTSPTLAEPLFATNEAEVERYGVKALRDSNQLPPSSRITTTTTTSTAAEVSSDNLMDVSCTVGSEDEASLATPRRPRSRTLSVSPEDRRSTPTQHHHHHHHHRHQLPTPTRSGSSSSRLANPLKKSNTAPYVLQPSAYGYGQEMQDALALEEIISQTDQLNHHHHNNNNTHHSSSIIDSFMEATPTLEPTRSKRKASEKEEEEFGPVSHLRRGARGERVPVASPSLTAAFPPVPPLSDSYLSYPYPPPPSSTASSSSSSASSTRCPTPSRQQPLLRSLSDRNLPHSHLHPRDHVDFEESCPELSPASTATTTSPFMGPLTRTNTPGNLDAMIVVEESRPYSSSSSSSSASRKMSGISRSATHGHLGYPPVPGSSSSAYGKRLLRRGSSIGPLVH